MGIGFGSSSLVNIQKIATESAQSAVADLHAQGLPAYGYKNGLLVAHNSDGTVTAVTEEDLAKAEDICTNGLSGGPS